MTTDNKHGETVPSYCQVLRFKDSNGQMKEMIFPKALDLDRPKRPRTTFSEAQLSSLENEFQRNPYLIGKDRTRLALDLGLTETQVKVWFQNRRTKSKRSKTGLDDPASPSSPSSNCDSQSLYEERSRPLPKVPVLDSHKIEPLEAKRGNPSFNIDQLTNSGGLPPPYGKGGMLPFPPCPPSQPLSVTPIEYPAFGQVTPAFSELVPIQRQPQLAAPTPQFFGPMQTGQSQNPNWAAQALWFPWSGHLAPCLQQMKPSASSK